MYADFCSTLNIYVDCVRLFDCINCIKMFSSGWAGSAQTPWESSGEKGKRRKDVASIGTPKLMTDRGDRQHVSESLTHSLTRTDQSTWQLLVNNCAVPVTLESTGFLTISYIYDTLARKRLHHYNVLQCSGYIGRQTCDVRLARLIPSPNPTGWYSINLPWGMDGWVDLGGWVRSTYRDVSRQSPIQVVTGPDVEQLCWSRPMY